MMEEDNIQWMSSRCSQFILTEPQLLLSDIEEVLFDKLQNKILQ